MALPLDQFLGLITGSFTRFGYQPHEHSFVVVNIGGTYIRGIPCRRGPFHFFWGIRREGGQFVRFFAQANPRDANQTLEIVYRPNTDGPSWFRTQPGGEPVPAAATMQEALAWVETILANDASQTVVKSVEQAAGNV